jgi:hypothetical protein
MATATRNRAPRFAVYLRSTSGATWARERVRVVVDGIKDEFDAVMDAKARMVAEHQDWQGCAWYAERVVLLN